MTDQVYGEPEYFDGELVVQAARRWIGTPYLHRASQIGTGADCLGLVRGIWRDLLGVEPEEIPEYTPDWGELGETEILHEAATRHLLQISLTDLRQGDVVLMRMADIGIAKHLGVLGLSPEGYRTIVHAYSGRSVVESPLAAPWARRIVAAFRFPARNA